MERRLFREEMRHFEVLTDDEDGGIDIVDEIAERRAAMPARGDGGRVVM